jgi:DHA1 family bicyclomycin/chloramphenicol resistance-like MFS transporter
VQATISVFIAGFAVATVIYGPISDRYGRRTVLIVGLIVFVLGGLGCMTAGSIEALIYWRFVQEIGGCAGPVLARAIVRDLYEGDEAARLLSYMASAMALAPAVAPLIRCWLHVMFGWQSHFVMLAVIGAALTAAVTLLLSETNTRPDRQATNVLRIVGNVGQMIRHGPFIVYSCSLIFAYDALFSFISVSAFVVIDVLGVLPERFGYLFFFVALGFVGGGMAGGRLVTRLGFERLVGAGVSIGLGIGVVRFGLALLGIEIIYAVIVPIVGVFFACSFVLPSATASALMPFPLMAGTASSAISFLQMSGGAAIGYLAGVLHDGTTVPLFALIIMCWICSGGIYYGGRLKGFIRPSVDARGG